MPRLKLRSAVAVYAARTVDVGTEMVGGAAFRRDERISLDIPRYVRSAAARGRPISSDFGCLVTCDASCAERHSTPTHFLTIETHIILPVKDFENYLTSGCMCRCACRLE